MNKTQVIICFRNTRSNYDFYVDCVYQYNLNITYLFFSRLITGGMFLCLQADTKIASEKQGNRTLLLFFLSSLNDRLVMHNLFTSDSLAIFT